MRKLLFLLLIPLLGCSGMDYTYEYITEDYIPDNDLPVIECTMTIVDELEPNVFVLETHLKAHQMVEINAISMKINYNPEKIGFREDLKINEKLYINEFDNPALLGITLYNITENQICYSFATLQETLVQDEFIFRQVIEVKGQAALKFSTKAGDLEFMAMDGSIYPLKYRFVNFIKL